MPKGLTIEEAKQRLLPLDSIRELLATTEPFGSLQIPAGEHIRFQLNKGWNHGLESLRGTDSVNAYVDVKGSGEFQLTLDALLEATSLCGLPKGYVKRTPSNYIEDQLNYWFREGKAGTEFKILTTKNTFASAVIRGTIVPFSNLKLLEEIIDGIEAQYGRGEVLADYKFEHSLRATHLRLVIPEKTRVIENTGVDDDTWSVGIQFKNSLIGLEQTSVDGYMFRYWCTNGATDTHASSGTWSRKGDGQNPTDVYDWARTAVDEILGGLENSLDHVQAMTDIPIAGEASGILRDVYSQYKIPVKLRDVITANMVDEENNMTMYSLMQAITEAANSEDVEFGYKDHLMSVGGELIHQANDRCEACRRIMPQ